MEGVQWWDFFAELFTHLKKGVPNGARGMAVHHEVDVMVDSSTHNFGIKITIEKSFGILGAPYEPRKDHDRLPKKQPDRGRLEWPVTRSPEIWLGAEG